MFADVSDFEQAKSLLKKALTRPPCKKRIACAWPVPNVAFAGSVKISHFEAKPCSQALQ